MKKVDLDHLSDYEKAKLIVRYGNSPGTRSPQQWRNLINDTGIKHTAKVEGISIT